MYDGAVAYRRLAAQRSWFLIVLGTVLLAGLVLFVLDTTVLGSGMPRDQLAIPVLGIPLALLMIARGVTGSWAHRQLCVDVAAGKVRLATGEERALDELGRITVTARRLYGSTSVYELRAEHVDGVLFESLFEADVQRRMTPLEQAVLQSRLRRVLERPDADGAFRSAPSTTSEVLRIAGDAAWARPALRALQRDPDATVRARATALLDTL